MIGVAIVGIGFLPFLLRLPSRTRNLFALSGIVYVGGAIGVEMLSASQADLNGEDNLAYALIVTLEELCEMVGVVLFLHALLDHLHTLLAGVRVRFATCRPQTEPETIPGSVSPLNDAPEPNCTPVGLPV